MHAARRLYAAITQPAPLGMGRQRAQQLRPKPQGALDPLPAIPSRIPAKHRPFLNAVQHILGEPGCSVLVAFVRGHIVFSCSAWLSHSQQPIAASGARSDHTSFAVVFLGRHDVMIC